ncbi:MAG: hypothetical protein JWM37_809 [Candidatus Saccharibacteria bacterium]|nr:hypothetical protein [Candidatus Saccharibacteria bacterium]
MDRNKYSNYTTRQARVIKGSSKTANMQTAPGKHRSWWRRWPVILSLAGLLLLIGGGATYAQLGPSMGQSSSTTGVNLQKGLVGWWKMDGNMRDATPYRHNGAAANLISAPDRKGKANAAYSFNGTSSVVGLGTVLDSPSSWSFSVWLKPTAVSSPANAGLLGEANNPRITFTDGSSNPKVGIFAAYADNTLTGIGNYSQSLSLGDWHHAVGTFSGANTSAPVVKLYVDGQLYQTYTGTKPIRSPSAGLFLNNRDNNKSFNGSMDDPRVYNRAINANEVASLYQEYDAQTNMASGEKGLVGWWKFDGNSMDATPFRNNGTVLNSTLASDRKNAANSAYSFNGTNSAVNLGNSTRFNGNSITMEAWIKPTSLSTTGIVMAKEFQYKYRVRTDGKLEALISTNGISWNAGAYTFSGGVVSVGRWQHAALVIDLTNSIGRLYLNGAQVASSVLATPISAYNTNPLYVGAYKNNASGATAEYFSGSIDDARIYMRALSANEIAAQARSYNSQFSVNSYSSRVSLSSGLIGYWPFSGNANDVTPYKRNGIVSGAILAADRLGRSDSAYNFPSGVQATITVPFIKQYQLNGAFTTSFWYADGGATATYPTIISQGNGATTGNGWLWFYTPSDGAIYYKRDNLYINSSTCLPRGIVNSVPKMYTFTSTASSQKLYVNGTLCSSAGNVYATSTVTNPLQFGNTGSVLTGTLDDVRVYNRVLSASEVGALYNDYR